MWSVIAIPAAMPRKSQDLAFLEEVRNWLLGGMSQTQVARVANVSQGRISAIETARVFPKKKHWPPLLRAYQLSEDEFHRMLVNARNRAVLDKPMSETEPLLAAAIGAAPATVTPMGADASTVEKVLLA